MDVLGNKKVAPDSWDFETHVEGPAGKIEFSAKMLTNEPMETFLLRVKMLVWAGIQKSYGVLNI